MLLYLCKMLKGEFHGKNAEQIQGIFGDLMGKPVLMTVFMMIVVIFCFSVCSLGVQKGLEKITKYMMLLLLALLVILAVRSVTLPGAEKGLSFYLVPDFQKVKDAGCLLYTSRCV